MKSEKGIAMMSLVVYVASFLVITLLVGTITSFFYSNVKILDANTGSAADYNKINLYMVGSLKSGNLRSFVLDNSNPDENKLLVTMYTDESHIGYRSHQFQKKGNTIYYDYTALCNNVETFELTKSNQNGKDVIDMHVVIGGNSYTNTYVIKY